MSDTGRLSVDVRGNSVFLGSVIPIEVRDSHMQLVQQGTPGRYLDLAEGIYEVSAILEDGRRHHQLAQVRPGDLTRVEFSAVPGTSPEESSSVAPTAPAMGDDTALIDVTGARHTGGGADFWLFECAGKTDSVPTARFRLGGREARLSLPLSAEVFPANICRVRVQKTKIGVRADAWIAPERTVANGLQNMLASGFLLHAAKIAEDAVGLLQSKYSDPTGAALGALILHKTDRLERYSDWVENVARDFDWLPDGKILLATLLFNRQGARDRALDLALRAARQTILYSESFSLLLDLLRRWPGDAEKTGRAESIRSLALQAPYIDWESTCLSITTSQDDDGA
jgi:hypothetical protein